MIGLVASHNLEFTEPARLELLRARSWYRKHHPDRVLAFLGEVEAALATIVEAPLRSPPVVNNASHRRRVLQRFPFVLVFHVAGDRVVVDAVRHTARRPDARFG